MENKEIKNNIIKILSEIDRPGMKDLINYLENESDYFTAPASTRFHLCIEGGLIIHSWSVYKLFLELKEKFNLIISNESIVICSFLHDLCKIGCYIKNNSSNGYSWNPNAEKGHSMLSIKRIEKFIKLTEQEREIIQFHMGMYGTEEFGIYKEYSLATLVNAYNKNKLAKLFYFCDDMSTNFLED